MRYKKIPLFFLLIFFCLNGFAAVFVVTSNADSGPGTLRDALTLAAANGNVEKDYINFNLPGSTEADWTILIKSDLPEINSDLVIDGTTQPGNALSINGAKIVISGFDQKKYDAVLAAFFLNNVSNFEMYGLIIKNIYVDFTQAVAPFGGGSAVLIAGTNGHLIFGAPGKGNVMYNVSHAIQAVGKYSNRFPQSETESVELKNNIFGITEDGITIGEFFQSGILLPYVYNTTVGGDTKADGNICFDVVSIVPASVDDLLKEDVHIKVKNNIFSANVLQQRPVDPNTNVDRNQQAFTMGANPNATYTVNTYVEVSDNVFGYTLEVNGFKNLNLKVQSNFFGISSDGKNNIPLEGQGVALSYIEGTTLIGGDDVSKGNVFTNCVQDARAIAYAGAAVSVDDFGPYLNPKDFIELSHNSFYCNNNPPFLYHLAPDKKPLAVTVDNLTANSVNGTTSANARVELFYTDKECTQCQPKSYITSTYADATGKWVYNGSLLPGYGVMAGATLNHVSSEFTDTRVYADAPYVKVTYSECSQGGKIEGALIVNAKKIEWLDSNGKLVGTGADLINVPAGTYTLRAEQFGCVIYSQAITIFDTSPQFNIDNLKVIQPSCSNSGSITGIYTIAAFKTEWIDKDGNVIGSQNDIENLAPGSYTLRITGQRGCVKTYGPLLLENAALLNIDQSKTNVQSTDCGKTTGSITNIQVTGGSGTLKYIWWNSQQQTVSTTQDLINQPAGTYKLEVTDDTQCGPVYTTDIPIPETNGITLDESKAQSAIASCSKDNGSITGIQVGGATQYQWADAKNKIVGTAVDLQNAPAGDYILTASNAFGCNKISQPYHIAQQLPTQFPSYTAAVVPACTGKNNGSVVVATDALANSARWVNSQGQTTSGKNSVITDVAAGTYQLYLTDGNGCESFYKSYTITTIPPLQIVQGSEQITSDQCALKAGSIANIQITGGVPPYSYSWVDGSNNVISTSPGIANVGDGRYTLNITDASDCGMVTAAYAVQNQNNSILAPTANNVQLCSPGDAILRVNNPSAAYSYRLYDSETSTAPADQQVTGSFKISVKTNTSFYVSGLTGDCESPRTLVQVSVGITTHDIENTFTPNGDGINDYWKIKGIDNYPAATINVFNRYGKKVFESVGYAQPFDGTYNGKNLPIGVYYYIINLSTSCSLLSGSVTIIR